MSNWDDIMASLMETETALRSMDVMDIQFESGHSLEVFVAASPEDRAMGLSKVHEIPLDGMLFVYSNPVMVPFTMAKMNIDLEIAWFSADGTLIKSGTYKKGSQDPIFCPEPFSYVLETPVGGLPSSNLKVRKRG